MKKISVIPVTLVLLGAICWSCSFHNFEEDVKIDLCDPNDTTTISFADTIFPIFTRYCSNQANGDCHWPGAATPKPNYTIYSGIKQKVDEGRIQARLFDQNPGPMPPPFTQGPSSMSDCEKMLIQRWIDQGALNN